MISMLEACPYCDAPDHSRTTGPCREFLEEWYCNGGAVSFEERNA